MAALLGLAWFYFSWSSFAGLIYLVRIEFLAELGILGRLRYWLGSVFFVLILFFDGVPPVLIGSLHYRLRVTGFTPLSWLLWFH